jgi:hypothetical protein
LIRVDIPLADQIVQVGHACLEAGFKFEKPNEVIHLVLVGVESEFQLLATVEKLRIQNIEYILFHEPDDGMGFTAACIQPLTVKNRRELRDFPLWKAPREETKTQI